MNDTNETKIMNKDIDGTAYLSTNTKDMTYVEVDPDKKSQPIEVDLDSIDLKGMNATIALEHIVSYAKTVAKLEVKLSNTKYKSKRYYELSDRLTNTNAILAALSHIIRQSIDGLDGLVKSCNNLRDAQKKYMADRGNDELGKKVGEAAEVMDELLAQM